MGFVKFLFKPHNAETSSNNFIVPTTKTTKAIKKNIYYEIELKFNLTAAPCYPPCCCISSHSCGEASCMSCCAVCRAAVSGCVTWCHVLCCGRAEACHAVPHVVPCVACCHVSCVTHWGVTCRGHVGVSHTVCCALGCVVGGACIVLWSHWGVPRGAA